MSWFTNLFAKHSRNIHLGLIVIFSAGFIAAPAAVMPPVRQVIVSVFHFPFAHLKSSIAELRDEAAENDRLRRLLTQSSMTIAMYEEAVRENVRLRSVLGFEPPPGYELLPAEVISLAGDFTPIYAVIDKGASDSVLVDQPVINQQGLIGRVSSVSQDYATIQLLTDPSNRVAARLARSREVGIVKFTSSRGMILDNLPVQGTVAPGDTVLSSGLGGVYPPGLKVGTVVEVRRPDLEPFCEITIDPAVNFYSIDEIFILKTGAR
ncbi:MAG: rod shape-determining protein MreC [Candidatus Zixiibacteriota bacterium]|nr:MAG: rod shape-determining protein MreC [candidate division Zixibacteria bacterium]